MESKIRPGGTYLQKRSRLTDIEKSLAVERRRKLGKRRIRLLRLAYANYNTQDG